MQKRARPLVLEWLPRPDSPVKRGIDDKLPAIVKFPASLSNRRGTAISNGAAFHLTAITPCRFHRKQSWRRHYCVIATLNITVPLRPGAREPLNVQRTPPFPPMAGALIATAVRLVESGPLVALKNVV